MIIKKNPGGIAMTEKKFYSPVGTVTDASVASDYESASKYDKAFIGALGVYFQDGFKTKYVPYSALERAFIRIQEVNGRFCCGKAVFAYFRLILVVGGKEWGTIMSEDEKAMDDALAAIAERSPSTAIGFVK